MYAILAIGSMLTLPLASFVPLNDFLTTDVETSASTLLAQRVVIDESDLIIVAFDPDEAPTYNIKGMTFYVEAYLDAFPTQDYPSALLLTVAYDTVRNSPTLQNGEALEQAFAKLAESIPDAEKDRMQQATMQAMTNGMLQNQLELMGHLADGFREAFSPDKHSALDAFYDALEDLASDPNEVNGERADTALEDFEATLTDDDQDRVDNIRKQAYRGMVEEYSDLNVQSMIRGWVASIKESRQYLRGDKGDFVSDAAFDKLNSEMSYDEVHAIIGREGDPTVSTSSRFEDVTTTSAEYLWSWELKPGTIARIHASFYNDQLRVKAYDEVPD